MRSHLAERANVVAAKVSWLNYRLDHFGWIKFVIETWTPGFWIGRKYYNLKKKNWYKAKKQVSFSGDPL